MNLLGHQTLITFPSIDKVKSILMSRIDIFKAENIRKLTDLVQVHIAVLFSTLITGRFSSLVVSMLRLKLKATQVLS